MVALQHSLVTQQSLVSNLSGQKDPTSLVNDYNILVDFIKNKLNSYEKILEQEEELRNAFLQVLYHRDDIEKAAHNRLLSLEQLLLVEKYDASLRTLSWKALDHIALDFEQWRQMHSRSDIYDWWWRLDEERFDYLGERHNIFRPIIQTFIAATLLYFSLGTIVDTANRVSNFLVSVFARSNAASLGLDLLTVGTFLVQIILGGQISLSFAGRLSKTINLKIKRFSSPIRILVTLLFAPISPFLVGTLVFITVIWLMSIIIVPAFGSHLRAVVGEVESPLSDKRNLLDLAVILDSNAQYPIDLMKLGISYEAIGDFEQARQLYERSLSAEPSLIVTVYLLSEVYTELNPDDPKLQASSLHILDQALANIFDVKNGSLNFKNLRLKSENYIPQMEYLLLVERAKVFSNMEEIGAAIDDLIRAEIIAKSNSSLFVRFDNKNIFSTSIRDDMPVPIWLTELYHLRAKSCQKRFDQTKVETYRNCLQEYSTHVLQLADKRIGKEVIWSVEANEVLKSFRNTE